MILPLNMPEPKPRCESIHPERGTQCGLPADHIGQHQNGTLCAPWADSIAKELAARALLTIKLIELNNPTRYRDYISMAGLMEETTLDPVMQKVAEAAAGTDQAAK